MKVEEIKEKDILFDYRGNKYIVNKVYNNNSIEIFCNGKNVRLTSDSIESLMLTKIYNKSTRQGVPQHNLLKQKPTINNQKSNAIFESKSEFLNRQEKLNKKINLQRSEFLNKQEEVKKNINLQRLERLIKNIKQKEIIKNKEIERQRKLKEIRLQKEKERQIQLDKQRQLQRERDEQLKKDSEVLKSFLADRKIKYLIHFTDKNNIESIRKNGILSRAELDKQKIDYKHNDENRYDGCYDGISLSITEPNYYLLNRYKENENFNPVFIKIDATILYKEYKNKRIYCVTNAGNRVESVNNGGSLEHFLNMFKDVVEYSLSDGRQRIIIRKDENREENETTDTQAEILFFGRIDPKYIISIESAFIRD